MDIAPVSTLPHRLSDRAVEVAPGVAVAFVIAVVATLVGRVVPLVGSAVPAVVIGVVVALVRRPTARVAPGIAYSGKFLLQCAVVLLGFQLSLGTIATVGLESLPVMLTSLVVCLVAAALLGRAFGVERRLRTLIGVGTGICGASAIAAVSPVIGAASAEIAYAVSTIFLFNVTAVVVFPLVGHALGLSPHAFGLFAGTAVNDTSSVVAAASVFSASALGFAVVVKLVRTLMIIPISVGLAVIEGRREASAGLDGRNSPAAARPMTARRVAGLVPWFLVGFVVIAIVKSFVPMSAGSLSGLVQVSTFLIAMALAGIGLSTDVKGLRSAGWKPLALGAILWVLVAATTLATMTLTGALR
ncbi:putative integral membrane protein (TIGR00698 family) [Frondihabitans sp. PhB188]|uniref:YeiH family protein n=1 Tax=Frondihabitans sp. PhB188 TaxID=2485200 RepID=UPI000F491EBC|nr:putative sulfate exporter family transporter [Frondihabitans sp. PhB188]ROQ38619.1 putative integral membrane protein (TIGR00698 family) [Frondihabitans sp. PhB188]